MLLTTDDAPRTGCGTSSVRTCNQLEASCLPPMLTLRAMTAANDYVEQPGDADDSGRGHGCEHGIVTH